MSEDLITDDPHKQTCGSSEILTNKVKEEKKQEAYTGLMSTLPHIKELFNA